MPLPQELTTHTKLAKYLAMFVFIVLPLITFFIGINYEQWIESSQPTVQIVSNKVTTHINNNQTVDTSTWKTYINKKYTIQYPATWMVKSDPTVPTLETIYDPSTLHQIRGNGVSMSTVPTNYVNITTFNSTQSPKEYVDQLMKGPPYSQSKSDQHTIILNGVNGESYKEESEGSMGYDVVVSDGSTLFIINIPTAYPTSDATINSILSTFKLTQ